jgi:hypothetical protein
MLLTTRAYLCVLCVFVVQSIPLQAAPKRVEPVAKVERPAAAGTYLESDGAKHAWRVTPGHALLWEERPFLPVGEVFRAESLRDGADAAWERSRR